MPTLAPPKITDLVGDGRTNQSGDVLWVELALACLGRYPTQAMAHGIIERVLDDAISNYQRDRGLRRDGLLRPGGETERCLRIELAHLAEGAG